MSLNYQYIFSASTGAALAVKRRWRCWNRYL